jgi:thiol-disulfide isomerase/thioredoxin
MDVSAKHIILFCLIYFSILWFVENYIRTKYNLLHSNRYIKAVGSNVKRNYLSLLQHSNQDLLQNDSDSNNNNANIIYLFLNPFCEPCKEEFLSVFNLIANKTLIINPILIYNDKKGKEIVEIILTLSKSHNQLNVLYDWYNYGYKNVSKFMSNYNIFVPDEDSKEELSTNQTMLTKYSITATPAIIYMNKRLPNYFSIIDIFNS